jgi:hypothetical protein
MTTTVSNLETRDGRWKQREKAVYQHQADWLTITELGGQMAARSGEVVRILRLLTPSQDFKDHPSREQRAAVAKWAGYRVKFPDGFETAVFEDELLEVKP